MASSTPYSDLDGDRGNMPLVAIATPVYNGAQYLAETMECVQAQTYPNLVHCLLDNASTDETADIIERFRGRRVPLIVARNAQQLSLLDNWNAVLRLVPGAATYFRILPADDLIVPDGIEKMVAAGERNPEVGIIGCQERAGDTIYGTELPSDRTIFDGKEIVRGSLLNAIHGFPNLHCLYRKPPGPLPERFYETEFYGTPLLGIDLDAAMRALSHGPYAYVHEPLVITRLHADSITSTEVNPRRIKMWSELQLIDRWGPLAFKSRAGYLACRMKHLRFYYRYLLLWRARRQDELLQEHLGFLKRASALPSAWNYLCAIAEWPALKLTRKYRDRFGSGHPHPFFSQKEEA